MCSTRSVEIIRQRINQTAKEFFGSKLKSVVLFGSYARGDFDEDSDMDIMIIADILPEECQQYRKKFSRLLSELGLEHDILISLLVQDQSTFDKWADVLPFYRNIRREGVLLSA